LPVLHVHHGGVVQVIEGVTDVIEHDVVVAANKLFDRSDKFFAGVVGCGGHHGVAVGAGLQSLAGCGGFGGGRGRIGHEYCLGVGK